MTITSRSLIGKGPSFPLNVSDTEGLAYQEDIKLINQSLFILFETPKGSRLMMPEFGSDIRKYRFEPLDNVLVERIKYTITSDISRWEPRITLIDIDFLTDADHIDNNTLYISIRYRIINTSIEANYVYPYRLETYDTVSANYN